MGPGNSGFFFMSEQYTLPKVSYQKANACSHLLEYTCLNNEIKYLYFYNFINGVIDEAKLNTLVASHWDDRTLNIMRIEDICHNPQ